jgi:hypothetical protein
MSILLFTRHICLTAARLRWSRVEGFIEGVPLVFNLSSTKVIYFYLFYLYFIAFFERCIIAPLHLSLSSKKVFVWIYFSFFLKMTCLYTSWGVALLMNMWVCVNVAACTDALLSIYLTQKGWTLSFVLNTYLRSVTENTQTRKFNWKRKTSIWL